jgi:hypothetical protein
MSKVKEENFQKIKSSTFFSKSVTVSNKSIKKTSFIEISNLQIFSFTKASSKLLTLDSRGQYKMSKNCYS